MTLFSGLSAFPITPVDGTGRVDIEGVARLTSRLAEAGVDSIGLLGSTGLYVYLSREERRRAVRAAVAAAGGRTPVMVGIGALRTDAVCDLARDAADEGADALLLAPVSYTPLTEDEAFGLYATAASATPLPLCIYNNPSTTHFSFTPALLARLATVPNIQAVKMPPPSGSVADDLRGLAAAGAGALAIGYSGDWVAPEALLAGAAGWYSVTGGALPGLSLRLTRAAQGGDRAEVQRLETMLQPLWTLFRRFGGLRVIHAGVTASGLPHAELPRPLLPLSGDDRDEAVRLFEQLHTEDGTGSI